MSGHNLNSVLMDPHDSHIDRLEDMNGNSNTIMNSSSSLGFFDELTSSMGISSYLGATTSSSSRSLHSSGNYNHSNYYGNDNDKSKSEQRQVRRKEAR